MVFGIQDLGIEYSGFGIQDLLRIKGVLGIMIFRIWDLRFILD